MKEEKRSLGGGGERSIASTGARLGAFKLNLSSGPKRIPAPSHGCPLAVTTNGRSLAVKLDLTNSTFTNSLVLRSETNMNWTADFT